MDLRIASMHLQLQPALQSHLPVPLVRLVADYTVVEEVGDWVILQVPRMGYPAPFGLGRIVARHDNSDEHLGVLFLHEIEMVGVPLNLGVSMLHRKVPCYKGHFGSKKEMTKALDFLDF